MQKQNWIEANEWERQWHGSCANSYNEETKQYIYAHHMGLDKYATNNFGQRGWDFGDQSILDVGSGPYSILLKSKAARMVAIDPCQYPEWISVRYAACGIDFINIKAEMMAFDEGFDECLIYNCLQHTEDPEKILERAWLHSKMIRVFEWIDEPISDGHIHTLTERDLNKWLNGEGRVLDLNQNPCIGRAYVGIFPGMYWQSDHGA